MEEKEDYLKNASRVLQRFQKAAKNTGGVREMDPAALDQSMSMSMSPLSLVGETLSRSPKTIPGTSPGFGASFRNKDRSPADSFRGGMARTGTWRSRKGRVPPVIEEGLEGDELSMFHASEEELTADLKDFGGTARRGSQDPRRVTIAALRRKRLSIPQLLGSPTSSERGMISPTARDLLQHGGGGMYGPSPTRKQSLWAAVQDEEDALADPGGDLMELLDRILQALVENPELLNPVYDPPENQIRLKFRWMLRTNHFIAQTVPKVKELAARVTRGFTVKAEVNTDLRDEIDAEKKKCGELETKLEDARQDNLKANERLEHMLMVHREEVRRMKDQGEEERRFWEAKMVELENTLEMQRTEMEREARHMVQMEKNKAGSDQLERMVRALQKNVDAQQEALESRDRTILSMKKEAEDSRVEIQSLREQVVELDGQVHKIPYLQDKVDAAQQALEAETEKRKTLEERLKKTSDRLAVAEIKLDKAQRDLQKAGSEAPVDIENMSEMQKLLARTMLGEEDHKRQQLAEVQMLKDKIEEMEMEEDIFKNEIARLELQLAWPRSVQEVQTDEIEMEVLPTMKVERGLPVVDGEAEHMDVDHVAYSALDRTRDLAMYGMSFGVLWLDEMRRMHALTMLRFWCERKKFQRALNVRDEVTTELRDLLRKQGAELDTLRADKRRREVEHRKEVQGLEDRIAGLKVEFEQKLAKQISEQESSKMIKRETERQCEELRRTAMQFAARFKRRMRMRNLKLATVFDGNPHTRRTSIPSYLLHLRGGSRVFETLSEMLIVESKLAELRRALLGCTISRRLQLKRLHREADRIGLNASEELRDGVEARLYQTEQHVVRMQRLREEVRRKAELFFYNFSVEDPADVIQALHEGIRGIRTEAESELQEMSHEGYTNSLTITRCIAGTYPTALALSSGLPSIPVPQGPPLPSLGIAVVVGKRALPQTPASAPRQHTGTGDPSEVQRPSTGSGLLQLWHRGSEESPPRENRESGDWRTVDHSTSLTHPEASQRNSVAVWHDEIPSPRPFGSNRLTDSERSAQGLRPRWTPVGVGGGGMSATKAAGSGMKLNGSHRPQTPGVPAPASWGAPGSTGSLKAAPRGESYPRLKSGRGRPPISAATSTSAA
eukprot:Hpha_TRINITY_DN33776_c0_g1::TRINITY_DN33776_c0_g1_i1::g.25008::m.25008